MKKVGSAAEVESFEQIPNVGPRMADDFLKLGIKKPQQLKGKDAFRLYKRMCEISNVRQDPCVLDTYMAAIDFMNGGESQPWWNFTKKRKAKYPNI